jgi:hypothetical protein
VYDTHARTRNVMGAILSWQHVTTGDGQRAGKRALTAWRPAVGSPSSPVGRLCHGYCVPKYTPHHKTHVPRSVNWLAVYWGWPPRAVVPR